MAEHDHRNFAHAEVLRGQKSSMACDDHAVCAHQDRVDESEFGDRCSNLYDLRVTMGAGIADKRHQVVNVTRCDVLDGDCGCQVLSPELKGSGLCRCCTMAAVHVDCVPPCGLHSCS